MKRIVLSMAVIVTLVLGGAFANTASAGGPHGHGHGHHGHHHGHYRPSYPIYGGYCAPYAPYGGGYYSSYPGYYYARPQPRVSLYFGF
jgi:hypothetical protein